MSFVKTLATLAIGFAAPLTFLFSILPTPGAGVGLHEVAYDTLVAVALSSGTTPPGLSGAASAYVLFRLLMTSLSLLGIPGFLRLRRRSAGNSFRRRLGRGDQQYSGLWQLS